MNVRNSVVFGLFLLVAAGCDSGDPNGVSVLSLPHDFIQGGVQDWEHGFSDFPAKDSAQYELKYAYTDRPSNLGTGKAIMLSGNNRNGDLFMYLKKRISGLQPDAEFTLTFKLELASDAKAGMTTADGAPGEDVVVKVGAMAIEPKSVIENGKVVMNIDKGDPKSNGENMIKIGNVASFTDETGYSLIALNSSTINGYSQALTVRTSSKGDLWFLVGTDSQFRSTTTLYYTKIDIFLSASYK